MTPKDAVKKAVEILGTSGEITLDINEEGGEFSEMVTELNKARVRLELTKSQVSVDVDRDAGTIRIYDISGGKPANPRSPAPSQSKARKAPKPRPKPKRHQHSYKPPKMATDIVSILSDEGSHVIQLVGPTGCGKTTLVRYLGEQIGQTVFQINCRGDMGSESFLGEKTITVDEDTKQNVVTYQKGTAEMAMTEGLDENGQEVGEPGILFVDEIPACPAHVAHAINRLLESDDPRRSLVLDTDAGRIVRSHSGFRIIVAGNTAGRGATELSHSIYTAQLDALDFSLLRRVAVTMPMGYSKSAEKHILAEKIGDDRISQLVLKFRDAVREQIREGKLSTPFTTGHLISIADMYRIFGDISKSIYLAVVEKLLPEERVIYNESVMTIFGTDMLDTYVDSDMDYM